MGFNCLKTAQPLLEDNLLVITKSPEVPGTHLINLKRMEGWVPTTLVLESSALTTTPVWNTSYLNFILNNTILLCKFTKQLRVMSLNLLPFILISCNLSVLENTNDVTIKKTAT